MIVCRRLTNLCVGEFEDRNRLEERAKAADKPVDAFGSILIYIPSIREIAQQLWFISCRICPAAATF